MNIKDALKKSINKGKRIDSDSLYNELKDYKYVSFDIFDTLVKRNVAEPTDIFTIMERQLGYQFKSKRIESEKMARSELGKAEVTIEDIYSYFPEQDRENLIGLELNTEFDTIVPNLPVADVYKRCVDAGKKIYITSDMYWSEDTVKKLLKKNGFSNYRALYLSSAQQMVKSDGTLFASLLQNEGIDANQIIHVGDSRASDYEQPTKLGIKAVRIPRYYKNIEFRGDENNSTIELNYLNHFINNTFHYTDDPYYQFGYAQFGKLLYGYVHWIHDQAEKRGIKKIFFFARDGYIMKQAYEACIDDSAIEVRYLEVSRRSLRGPVLWMDCSHETILNMVVNAKLVRIQSIFDGLGLDIQEYTEAITLCGLSVDEIFDRSIINEDQRLDKLLEAITPDIIKNSKKEYQLLIRYLKENNVFGCFAVVDIGYAGSMQRYLQQILTQLEIEHNITGFYLAVADFYTKNLLLGVDLDLNGYLFDFQHNKAAKDTRRSFVGLFETLFLEQGGSVKRYALKHEKVEAERYPYEYMVNGKPTEDLAIIRRIQSGAIDFIKNAAKDNLLKELSCSAQDYFEGLYAIGTNPRLSDLSLFGDISFYDEGITERLAAPKSCVHYIIHPKRLKEDFLRCRWKTGFLKRLLKVNLPYQRIYERLRSMR